ncbi:MAG: magnesium transporter [Eubacteriales bacterium]|nr:magnesium transporter [Eubacteriales bacterium]MDD3198694.1 magnesium transporter [Eubacteriales bacterium]MDD4121702.1 magnesium transporter [Eubacteriales bacterium]MDD4629060.1 magnesium transporter [Eubacteriales bacterium]
MENEFTMDGIIKTIIELLKLKKYSRARDEMLKNNTVEIAEILEEIIEELGIEKAIISFRTLPKDVSVEVFAYLPIDDQIDIIAGITDREIQYIMDELAFDDMIDVLEELPANVVDKILEKTTKDERRTINTFLNYPETSAGSLMTPDYISLRKNMTVADALAYIKKEGMDTETVYTCYVKDEGRKLLGIVSLRTLVVSDDHVRIEELMHEDMVYVNVLDDQEQVSDLFKKYGFLAMPVVDNEQRLVGIITVDDILDVIDEETTEDFHKMAGVAVSTEEYLDMSVWKHVKNRLPWLFILMLSYVVTGGIISSFEDVLSNVIVLVTYLPMLMGTGGNSGSQSATLIIRGLALGDVDTGDALKVLWKELRVSFLIGLVLSVLNFARIYWMDGEGVMVALTVCGAMLVIVMAAKTIGSMLPMGAKKVGIDPALMASPMIASLTDMVSVVAYFALATLILGI